MSLAAAAIGATLFTVAQTKASCWTLLNNLIASCAASAGNAEARALCYTAARDAFKECLTQVPTTPPPTTRDCWTQFLQDLMDCQNRYKATVPGLIQEQQSACLKGAADKWSWCFGAVPKPKITMVTPDPIFIAAGVDKFSIEVSSPDGNVLSGEIDYVVADATEPSGYATYLGGALPSIPAGGTATADILVPPQVRAAGGPMLLVFKGQISLTDKDYCAAGASGVVLGQ
jgi:hypothetical protein